MAKHSSTPGPQLTIVGGRPSKHQPPHESVEVPVGMEQLLMRAASDEAFAAALIADRSEALARFGLELRPSERAMLDATPERVLAAMIRGIVPTNPRRRKFMGVVAAAATSVAAGTAFIACEKGAEPSPAGQPADDTYDGRFYEDTAPDADEEASDADLDGDDAADPDAMDVDPDAVDAETDGELDGDQ